MLVSADSSARLGALASPPPQSITLIDSANLLHLLKQQGMEYRIDLEEARRLRPNDYSNR